MSALDPHPVVLRKLKIQVACGQAREALKLRFLAERGQLPDPPCMGGWTWSGERSRHCRNAWRAVAEFGGIVAFSAWQFQR